MSLGDWLGTLEITGGFSSLILTTLIGCGCDWTEAVKGLFCMAGIIGGRLEKIKQWLIFENKQCIRKV